MRTTPVKIALWLGLSLFVAGVIILIAVRPAGPKPPLASVQLADGRILQIEAVTYGTEHLIGSRSVVIDRFGPWLPRKVREFAEPKYPRSELNLDKPGLVVWVNAIDPVTGKPVDCQGIRVEFIDDHGDLFGQETSHWFGHGNFWRVGHKFSAFPRTQRQLAFQITPWRSNQTARVRFPNPFIATPAHWKGQPLPQQQRVGGLDILLTALTSRTNGSPTNYWETPARYWEPVWELREGGEPAPGWDAPDWTAEDPSGNHGKFLGTHQPALRFSATFYPRATNSAASFPITKTPSVAVTNFGSTNWWNISARFASNEILVLGLFPAGTHVFSEGIYQTNPPVRMGPTGGGAPSGWVGEERRLSPTRVQSWDGHYTPSPVIYLRAAPLAADQHLAVRLRDEQGRCWVAKPEPQGSQQDIRPFLIELPPDVSTVTAEVVVLKPVQASFDVDTTRAARLPP